MSTNQRTKSYLEFFRKDMLDRGFHINSTIIFLPRASLAIPSLGLLWNWKTWQTKNPTWYSRRIS
jgi:hypothetical protein